MNIELPPKYYLDHFRELKRVLLEHYQHLFDFSHSEFLSQFDSLSEDAQCLYIRMLNRKGRFFFRESLSYDEIVSFDEALAELMEKSFISDPVEEDHEDLLDFLPKKKIVDLLIERNMPFKKSSPKETLVTEFRSQIISSPVLSSIIVQRRSEEIDYLLFLFFGSLQKNLSLYTLRDLGVRKASGRPARKARFESREEAFSQYFYERLYQDEFPQIPISEWPLPLNREGYELREKTLVSMGEFLRKEERFDEALEVFRHCKGYPGREKRIRLLYQLGLRNEAQGELEEILQSPASDLEYLFAEDFLGRKYNKQKRSLLTETLRSARKIPIDESYFRHPEAGVQDYLKTLGIESFHIENYLWSTFFGLFFWEELFESDKASFFNEFERAPADIYGRRFFELHEKEILEKLCLLQDQEEFLCSLERKISEKAGTPNGIFSWNEMIFPYLEALVRHATPDSLKEMLLYLAQDFATRSTGFPDLMLIEDKKIKFCEIKAEGDSLKQHQLLQMIALQRAGFEVEVLQVYYTYNPDQLYVVVDLETTGGMPPYHRITEIGAVKMRRGEVVEKFQTLINPERRISKNIEELTGITNEMVRTAPKFSEVAESFQEFTRGCIFVAHNVSFDYGFLRSEYERLEDRFVRPYICTRSWMRKYYPGLESYGLGKLTATFGIPLETHHRALCDAEAAAGLLNLINKKRAEASGQEP